MNTIDFILLGGLVFLLVVVAVRIWLGKKRSVEADSSPKVKQPQSKGPILDHYLKNIPSKSVSENDLDEFSQKTDGASESTEQHFPQTSSVKPVEQVNVVVKEEILDPLVLIKTFSAPPEKRIVAMEEAGTKKMQAAVPALIEALYEPDPAISAAASNALGKIGDPRAIEPLLEISRRNDAQLMKEMASSRGEDSNEKNENDVNQDQDQSSESPYNFKEMVVFKIDQLPQEYFQSDGTPIPRKDLVVKGLKDNNQQLRQMAAKAAIGLDNEDVIDPLIEALENPYEVESVRFMAAEALGGMNVEKSLESLLRALKDVNVAVRYSAAAALSGRREERVVMALIGAITDPDVFVKSSVAYALGATGNRQALDVLFDCMSDESEVVRFSAAKAIACFGSEEVIGEIKHRLDYANKKTKLALMEVMGQIKSDESVKILRGFLLEKDLEVSYKASMALMGQENLDILDELVEASKRFDEELFTLMKKNGSVPGINPGFSNSEKRSGVSEEKTSEQPKKDKSGSIAFSEILLKLRDGLHDENPNIRGSSANALGDHKEPEAVELLLSVISDENEFVRASAVSSLGRLGAEKALKKLLLMSGDASEEVRYALVKALAKFSHESAKLCLKKIAKSDNSSQVKRAARAALDKK